MRGLSEYLGLHQRFHGGALGETFGLRWSGPFAWWLYRTAYLVQIFGIRAKLRTALEWTVNLFSPRDLAKL